MKRILASFALALTISSAPLAMPAWGQSWDADQARDARQKGDIVPLKKIFRALKKEYGGYQLDAELFSKPGGGSEYRIVWMTEDGRRMTITVDAQTGRITNVSGAE